MNIFYKNYYLKYIIKIRYNFSLIIDEKESKNKLFNMSSFNLVEYLKQNPTVALIGATNDKSKYGNIILHDLINKGYKVFPINPRATTIDGHKAYKSLDELMKEHEIGLVVFVVPPKITLEILKDCLRLNLKKVWIQPGAGDENVRAFLEEHHFDYLMDACVMVMSRK